MTSWALMRSRSASSTAGVICRTTVAATRYGMACSTMARACSAGLSALASWRSAKTRPSAGGRSSNSVFWARSPGGTCKSA